MKDLAAQALRAIGDTRAVDALIHALSDEHLIVRRTVARALEKIGDARAAEALRQYNKNKSK